MTVLIKAHNDPEDGERPSDPLPHARLHDLRHIHATTLQIGRIASDASFGRLREHALPAPQRAALWARPACRVTAGPR
jgi:integrase